MEITKAEEESTSNDEPEPKEPESTYMCKKQNDLSVDWEHAWMVIDDMLLPNKRMKKTLEPGVYNVGHSDKYGYFFKKFKLNTEELIYDGKPVKEVMSYLNTFWSNEKAFRDYKINYKRGVLMYGLPGTGKSCIIKGLILQLIKLGGIAIMIDSDRDYLNEISGCLEEFGKAEPTKKILMCIEDIEGFVTRKFESSLINLIDGTGDINNIAFIATTNFIKQLPPRLTRPSRFDKIIEIPLPDENTRWAYLSHLGRSNGFEIPMHWRKGTAEMTYAEMKELFISITIFNMDFNDIKNRFKKDYGQEVA